jgi:hypothetical protein
MIRAACYVIPRHVKSRMVCEAMFMGINASKDYAVMRMADQFTRPEADVAIFWGFIEDCQRIMRDYCAAGKAVIYIYMGYWGRVGQHVHYKLAINDRHPTAYFQNRVHDGQRAERLGIKASPWRRYGKYILLAGMSAKAAWAERLEPVESYERKTIAELRALTDREIIYRPKPSWREAKPIQGARFSPGSESLEMVLHDCHAVVTHHSNVAVDALVFGIPAFALQGVAAPLGGYDLRMIEEPNRPPHRDQWINDISYCQWTVEEMATGAAWQHFKKEGLL